MSSRTRSLILGVLAGAVCSSAAIACGDKLVALGGGVPFDRIHAPPRPGNIILFLNPATRLESVNNDFALDRALTRAGHSVRAVKTREELQRALSEAEADVVLMDWADARELNARLTDKVPTLSVAYPSGPGTGARIDTPGGCVIDADKRRASKLLRAVNDVIEFHEKGTAPDCASLGGRGTT